MSKMSEFHMELEEQAYDLGYESLTQALEAGYTIDYKEKKLISLDELQAIAHEEWLREKKVVLGDLKNLLIGMGTAGNLGHNTAVETVGFDLGCDYIRFYCKALVRGQNNRCAGLIARAFE